MSSFNESPVFEFIDNGDERETNEILANDDAVAAIAVGDAELVERVERSVTDPAGRTRRERPTRRE